MHTDVRMWRIKGEICSKKHVIFYLRNYPVFRFFLSRFEISEWTDPSKEPSIIVNIRLLTINLVTWQTQNHIRIEIHPVDSVIRPSNNRGRAVNSGGTFSRGTALIIAPNRFCLIWIFTWTNAQWNKLYLWRCKLQLARATFLSLKFHHQRYVRASHIDFLHTKNSL